MQSVVDLPACTGANPKHPTFSVKRTSVAVSGEAADLGEVSVSEWISVLASAVRELELQSESE